MSESKKYIVLAAAISAVVTYGAVTLTTTTTTADKQITALENRIQDLEVLLLQKEEALLNARLFAFDQPGQTQAEKTATSTNTHVVNNTQAAPMAVTVNSSEPVQDDYLIIRDLITQADDDPRTFSEKISDLLKENPSRENLAIATKTVHDMAENQAILPDYALTSLYHNQTQADMKRVAAQVMSLRGDNTLLEKHITDAQAALKNPDPATRQKALVELGKTRYHNAANAVAPLLQDDDIGVKLDALLALRATGNQTHVHFAEALVNHPDPSVSWLANDVVSNLQNLSDRARTRLASADIAAELPVTQAQ